MKNIKKLTLKDEVARETRHIEEEVLSKEERASVEVTPEMDRKMEEMIREYEKLKAKRKIAYEGSTTETDTDEVIEDDYAYTEEFADEFVEEFDNISDFMDAAESYLSKEDREALAIGRKMLEKEYKRRTRVPRKRKLWIALVAIMVLMFAMGITSIGSKSYWKELWSRMLGEQENTVINVEDAEIMVSEDGERKDCFRDIENRLEIRPIKLAYIPENMFIKSYEIDEEQRIAKIFYEYNDKIILYGIYANDMDSSYTEKVADKHTDVFDVKTEKQSIVVDEYLIEESQEYRYVSYFEYGGIHYQLMGVMNREDFVEILKNLYYF